MVDWSKPLQTRDGTSVTYVGHYLFAGGAAVAVAKKNGELFPVRDDGKRFAGTISIEDIINVPEPEPKRSWKVYVHVGIDDRLFCTLSPIAVEPTFGRRLVEITRGQFDE